MTTNYPSALDVLTNPTANDSLNSPSVPHATQHANANDAIEALQTTVGITNSSDVSSIQHKLNATIGVANAASSTAATALSQSGVNSVSGKTGIVTLSVADVSGAAPLNSPGLTGTPTAPTAAQGTNTTAIATTAFVKAEPPNAHASSHAQGGNDLLTAVAIGAKPQTGFVDRTYSSLSMNGSSFQLTTGSTYDIYSAGTKYTKTTTQSVSITNDLTLHYVYFNSSGVLQVSTTPWNITSDNVPVATVYKDGSNYVIGDERHSAYRDKHLHAMLHATVGARYDLSFGGLTGTFTNNTLSVTRGRIYDEDISNDTGATKTTANLYYRNTGATAMRVELASATPYKASAGVLQYDDSGTLTGVSNNNYVNYWLYVTNDIINPLAIVVGQSQSNNLTTIRSEAPPAILLSTLEWKLIYRITYRNVSGTATYIENSDYRTSSSIPSGGAAATNASSVTFAPAGDISSTNVQSALEELDTKKLAATVAEAGTLIAGSANKATLATADKFAVSDSASSNVLKYATIGDLQAALWLSGQPRTLWQSGIPFIIPGGDGGSNGLTFTGTRGTFTLSAAIMSGISAMLTGCYLYLPAGAGGLVAAGWYWTTFSSDTAGEVFQETYSGTGQPLWQSSPTAHANLTAGRITQTTNEITIASFTLPGGSVGPNGLLRTIIKDIVYSSANQKQLSVKTGGFLVMRMLVTTAYLDGDFEAVRQNSGVINKQIGTRTNTGWIGYGNTGYGSDNSSFDTSVNQTCAFTMQLTNNADIGVGMIPRQFSVTYGA